ncbi:hypothetical protein JCM10449v2_005137 [Rhodotorula kratochvilovae]
MADSTAPSSAAAPPASDASAPTPAAAEQDHLAHGIRALALKKWADACDHLAQAVEASTEKHGELAPENVESLVLYGKALLGSAIAQSAVLGGAAPQDAPPDAPAAGPSSAAAGPAASTSSAAAGPSNPKFHFGGDGEDDDGAEGGDDEEEEGEGGEEHEGDESAAPGADREDDLESAFQALEVARTILQREVDAAESALACAREEAGKDALVAERRAKKEKLADVHRLLGDVATESEQFDAAVDEYSAALSALTPVLAPHDRALSELHMLIALALDFVPEATARAVAHAEKAKGVLLLRLAELERVPEKEREDKARREIDDIKSLMGDVDMKIEDLRTVPEAPAPSAADSALEALLRQSQGVMAQAAASGSVNDLTSLVKRKKKAPAAAAGKVVSEEVHPKAEGAKGGEEENSFKVEAQKEEEAAAGEGAKRKAEDSAEADGADAKKVKVEE